MCRRYIVFLINLYGIQAQRQTHSAFRPNVLPAFIPVLRRAQARGKVGLHGSNTQPKNDRDDCRSSSDV